GGARRLASDSSELPFLRYFAPPNDKGPQQLYGTFRWANTRFFLLNAMDEWMGAERVWLEAEPAAARGGGGLMHRIAVMHHGPWSSGPHGGNPSLVDGHVVRILRDGRVDLVLAGHDHVYERGEGEGLKYLISGGAGAPLYPHKRTAPETMAF